MGFLDGSKEDAELTEGISDNVIRSFNVTDIRTILFNEETPSHDAVGVEFLVGEILMISVND